MAGLFNGLSAGLGAWLNAALLFAAVLVVGFVLSWLWRRGIQQTLGALGRLLSAVDAALVRYVTWVFGTRWVKGRFATVMRWSRMTAAFALLSFAGATLPLPYAIVSLALGYIGVLTIIRQWNWDEEDRAQDVPDDLRRVSGGQDLVNEAMFGGVCLFLLTPVLFFRLDQAYDIFSKPPGLGLFAYAAYTLGEFLKAAPLLDYSEVYNAENISGVSTASLAGRNATFAFRVVLDLLLIGGLIQLIAIMQRIAAGRDIRRVEEMLTSNDDITIAEAISRLNQLALRNQINAKRALTNILEARDMAHDLRYSPKSRFRTASAIENVGNRFGDTPLLLTAVEAYRWLLHEFPSESHDWGAVQNNLAIALSSLGARRVGREGVQYLREAVHAYRGALAVCRLEEASEEWARTQSNLGNALSELGERSAGSARTACFQEAVEAHRAALSATDKVGAADEWATSQNNLGIALASTGAHQEGSEGTDKLLEAVDAFRASLTVRNRETSPSDWARTQGNLGSALMLLGRRSGGEVSVQRLREAVEADRAAFTVYTRADYPTNWAGNQLNLGNALRSLGEGVGGAEAVTCLREAVDAYRAALSLFTRDEMAFDHATAQIELGDALGTLGIMLAGREREERWREGIAACRAALAELERGSAPSIYAHANNVLGRLLLMFGNHARDDEMAIGLLRTSGTAHAEALSIFDREHTPVQWASTLNGLGMALAALGKRLGGPDGCEKLEGAAGAFRDALSVRSRADMLSHWAVTQGNLAETLAMLGELRGGAEGIASLQESISAYREVHGAFVEMNADQQIEFAKRGLERAKEVLATLQQDNC